MSESLATAFPDEFSEGYPRNQIVPQEVFRIYKPLFQKEKRVLIVAISLKDDSIVYAVINSEVNQNHVPERAKPYHLPLNAATSSFLDHDSFINCTELTPVAVDHLVEEINNGDCKPLGRCSDEDFQLIMSKLQDAPTISEGLKKKYLP